MPLQHLPEMAVFAAELPNNVRRWFTFTEFLGYFELHDQPLNEKNQVGWFLLLCGEQSNNHRLIAWRKVLEWRGCVPVEDNRRRRSAEVLCAYTDTDT
jgi:hypothetical protein